MHLRTISVIFLGLHAVVAKGLPLHSEVSHKLVSGSGGSITWTFTVKPNKGLVINDDKISPWALTATKVTGLEKSSYRLVQKDFDNFGTFI